MKQIAVLTGAGISAESGISTFRDSGGLWESYDIKDVATYEAWVRNPKLVLDFYNARRRQLLEVHPNDAHRALVQLEKKYDVRIITQNVDDLHERAGSTDVLHLHGELLKVRSTKHPYRIYPWKKDLHLGDVCEKGGQLRPHIVWFGEAVPLMPVAQRLVASSNIVIIIGTSMQVYPAAGLVEFAPKGARIFYIDPKPRPTYSLRANPNAHIIAEKATVGVPRLVQELLDNA